MGKKTTTEEFIKKSKVIHGNKYDYSKSEYISSKEKICIICPDHGEFWQLPGNHLSGTRCPKCAKKSRQDIISDTKEDFIRKSILKHGDRYDYSMVEYINSRTKVKIICPIHGEFEQLPSDHIRGYNCQKCQKYHGFNMISKSEQFIKNWLIKNKILFKHQFELITDQVARNSCFIIIDFFVKYNNNQFFIEYDGQQHFEYVPYFHKGGIIDFEKQQRRDQILNNFCELHKDKVTLIRFNYKQTDDEISEILYKVFN